MKTTGRLVAGVFSLVGALWLSGSLSPVVGAEASGDAQPASPEDRLLSRCISLLTYGDAFGLHEPGKRDAVVALGLLGDERALPVLIGHLENGKNPLLRMEIVRALGWIGNVKAVPALENALRDANPPVRTQAAHALKKITGNDYDYDRTGIPNPEELRDWMRSRSREAK